MSGVKVLTYLKKMDRAILRSMVTAFCHHLNMDLSGYPQTKSPIKPDAFSRIVRIADIYDALTSARSYRMKPFTRADALAIITDWSEYRNPDFDRIKVALKNPVIVDGRNLYKPDRMASAGFSYIPLGRCGGTACEVEK
jgi:HD-GYP domain-containing protein (c-di-GMP phosphodiesterase class II)